MDWLLDHNKLKSNTIHAVAFAGWLGTVVKHVTQMSTAAAAMYFGSGRQQRIIYGCADSIGDWSEKAGPAGTTVEFGFR